MKPPLIQLALITILFLVLQASNAVAWDVLVVQNYRARPYSDVVRGFRATCAAKTGELVLSELGTGDPLREIRTRRPDLILAIGMDSLVTVRKIRDIPIIYCMVLNPESILRDETNITGVSMNIPPEKQLAVLKKAIPHLKKIGLVYNSGRTGPIVARAAAAAEKMGIRLIALKAERANDLPRQLDKFPQGLDAYWMLPDSSLAAPEAVEYILLYSMRTKVPIFTFSEKYLRMGALLSLDLDAYELGRQTGEMAERIKAGTDVKSVSRIEADHAVPTINRAIAAKLGLKLDDIALKKFRYMNQGRP